MTPINCGTSLYHHVVGIYLRDETGTLLVVEGSEREEIRQLWPEIRQNILSSTKTSEKTKTPSGQVTISIQASKNVNSKLRPISDSKGFQIHELYEHDSKVVRGLLMANTSYHERHRAFFEWATRFLLLESRLNDISYLEHTPNDDAFKVAERVTDLFEEMLKNTSLDDAWLVGGGRVCFLNKAYGFIKSDLPIHFCLPAFPCKSSNPQKVGGVSPDAAEMLALRHLHAFMECISHVHSRGGILWIITDGHVFSDCIGVDDIIVDDYGRTLMRQYYERVHVSTSPSPIQFTGLEGLFFQNPDIAAGFPSEVIKSVELPQPVDTEHTERAQLCRQLLERMGGIDRDHLRQLIVDKDQDTLRLYQGQSRFMLDDLSSYLESKDLGTKKKKKLASKVAAEMIARNHAYSNLVELLFPQHIRLSIHAHSNSGPKFGIRLFPQGKLRSINSLPSLSEANPTYEFQIPTPWHNCLVEVERNHTFFLTKAGIARDAISTGAFEGRWCVGTDGGYFSLRQLLCRVRYDYESMRFFKEY
ncbi:Pyoverdine/dityrosine biosynthesis protein-domain-containing protein [Aspergillus californicus]